MRPAKALAAQSDQSSTVAVIIDIDGRRRLLRSTGYKYSDKKELFTDMDAQVDLNFGWVHIPYASFLYAEFRAIVKVLY